MLTAAEKSKRVTIKEAETRTKIPQRTIRKYVKDFPMIPVGRGQHQTLLFDLEAMELLIYTQHLFKERIPKPTIATLIEKRVIPNQVNSENDEFIEINMDDVDEQVSLIYSEETNSEVAMLTPVQSLPDINITSSEKQLEVSAEFNSLSRRLLDTEKMLAEHVKLVTTTKDTLLNQNLIMNSQSSEIDDLKKLVQFEKDRNLASVKAIFNLQDRLQELENPKTIFSKLRALFS